MAANRQHTIHEVTRNLTKQTLSGRQHNFGTNLVSDDERILWEQDVDSDVYRIQEILSTGIFTAKIRPHPLCESAFIEVMIRLNDLLAKAKNEDMRVDFVDDVITSKKVTDVTDLVAVIRNAACHIPSVTHQVDEYQNRFSFMVSVGRSRSNINGVILTADYEDDIAFFYGSQRIYFDRQIVRSFREAKEKLVPLIRMRQNFWPTVAF